MNEPVPAKSFRTKTGLCVIHPDRIELERADPRGALATALFGNSLTRVRGSYAALLVVLLVVIGLDVLRRRYELAFLTGLLVLFLARGLCKSRGLSASPVVQRAAITVIEAKAPRPPLTRGHFIIQFSENGQSLRRVVILPGMLEAALG